MNEAEWLACTDRQKMLEFVRGKASNRKLRLFACGCVRSIWHFLIGEISQRAVVAAEKYADGEPTATDDDMAEMYQLEMGGVHYAKHLAKGNWPKEWTGSEMAAYYAAIAAAECCRMSGLQAAQGTIWWADQANWVATAAIEAVGYSTGATFLTATGEVSRTSASDAERITQVRILQDLFGAPLWRSAVANPAWQTPSVVTFAQGIYDKRAFDRLPELATVLEEAGCHDAEILGHCRQQGPHVRGCWVVDLLIE